MADSEYAKANKQQLLEYLSGLYPEWRLLYIRSMKKMFDDYNVFYSDVASYPFTLDGERRPIKLGLTYASVAETMQYIEDLFALMLNTQGESLSIGKILNYSHDKVIKYITSFENKSEQEQIEALYICYIPDDYVWPNADIKETYTVLKDYTLECIKKIIMFRSRYRRFYTQYKHGLKIPMREFGGAMIDLEGDEIPLYSYESLKIENKSFTGIERNSFILPNPHPDVTSIASKLYENGDLLRCDMAVVRFDDVLDVAFLTYQLFSCLRNNLMTFTMSSDNDDTCDILFPSNDREMPFKKMSYLYEKR